MNDKFWCIKYETEFFSFKKETFLPECLCKYEYKKNDDNFNRTIEIVKQLNWN